MSLGEKFMSLFGGEKKKEEVKEATCCCGSSVEKEEGSCCSKAEATAVNTCCGEKTQGVCCIKVLGSDCSACHTLFENTKKAVAETGLNIEVEYITDMEKIMEYGVMSMPALIVNDKVAAMGKVLKAKEVKKYLI